MTGTLGIGLGSAATLLCVAITDAAALLHYQQNWQNSTNVTFFMKVYFEMHFFKQKKPYLIHFNSCKHYSGTLGAPTVALHSIPPAPGRYEEVWYRQDYTSGTDSNHTAGAFDKSFLC
jgi:hypothetical protein